LRAQIGPMTAMTMQQFRIWTGAVPLHMVKKALPPTSALQAMPSATFISIAAAAAAGAARVTDRIAKKRSTPNTACRAAKIA